MKPRVLFIASRDTDYLQDLTYRGLVQVLGIQNVVDYPWKLNFHVRRKPYPHTIGYCEGSLTIQNVWRSFTADIASFDVVVLGAAKPDCFQKYIAIAERISPKTRVVVLDGGDWATLGGDLDRLHAAELWDQARGVRDFDRILKREYFADAGHPVTVLPFPFSFDFQRYDYSKSLPQTYQTSFWAVESDPIRTRALNLLEHNFDCDENGTSRNQVARRYARKGTFYLDELARCKTVLNFRGVGWDTLRYWEVPGVGTLLISQRPEILIPDNFIDEEEIVFVQNDLSDLIDKISFYTKHENLRLRIARAGQAKAREHHSTEARATTLLKSLS